MEAPYTPDDQVCSCIINPSPSAAVLLNHEAFKDFYNQQVEDNGLPSYTESTWS